MEKNRLKNGAYDFIILANRWLWTLPANKPSIAPECRLEYSDQVWRHQTLMTCGGLSKWLRSSVDQDPLTHVWSLTLIRVSIEIILFALTNHLEVNLTNLISHLESFWTSVFFFFLFQEKFHPQWFTTSISLRAQSQREPEQHKTALYHRLCFRLKIVQIVLPQASIHQCSSFFNSNLERDSHCSKRMRTLSLTGLFPLRLSWCAAMIAQGNWLPWWRPVQENRTMTERKSTETLSS